MLSFSVYHKDWMWLCMSKDRRTCLCSLYALWCFLVCFQDHLCVCVCLRLCLFVCLCACARVCFWGQCCLSHVLTRYDTQSIPISVFMSYWDLSRSLRQHNDSAVHDVYTLYIYVYCMCVYRYTVHTYTSILREWEKQHPACSLQKQRGSLMLHLE